MDLKGREIFAVGKWNNMEFTHEDLEDIASNFEKLSDTHKVPLKFGHDADHNDGQPAIGWINNVFKQGDKLFADFVGMPKTVFEAIKSKLYRTVSVELLFNVTKDGKERFNHVLDAVALLGADHPAVNTLADLDALLATRTSFAGGHRVAFETIAGTSKKFHKKPVEVEMDKKEVQDLIDAATKPLADANTELSKDLKAANATIAKFTSDKADDEKKAKEEKIKLARANVTAVLDAAVKGKTMTPAIREVYEKQIGLDDDERVVSINVEEIKTMFSVKGDDDQTGLHKDDGDDIDDKDPGGQLLTLSRKYQADHGEDSLKVAFTRVSEANPELHRAYLDSNGEKQS